MAANQVGKTLSAGMETAMHLTGRYPDSWKGRVFDKAPIAWAAGITGESTRDNPQRIVLGRPGEHGTGSIPRNALLDSRPAPHGVADAMDHLRVRHGGGGDVQAAESLLYFKSYEKGRAKWQGETLDFVWFDEEPPEDIYSEGLTRTQATRGIVFITFTPLLGMSNVVRRFLIDKPPGTHVTSMTIEDAEHYTPSERAAIIAAYPAHERDARAKGIPSLGSGRVFPIAEEDISESAFDIPEHWPRLSALDFGYDHPTAAIWLAWDRDADCVHVYDAYRMREKTPLYHSAAINKRGKWIPVAWPHDGLQHDKGSGIQLAKQYKDAGVNMLPSKVTFSDGSNGVEAGIMDLLDRMETGRLRVAKHLSEWFEEFRLYHREDGQIVKENDDLMAATRYGIMGLRYAITRPRVQADPVHAHAFLGGAGGGWMS